MASLDLISVLAVLLAVGGLAAVVGEILVKSPRGLLEMMDDSRSFAGGPRASAAAPASAPALAPVPAPAAAANSDRRPLAA